MFTASCWDDKPSFRSLNEGIAFRRVTLGDGEVKVSAGDGVGIIYRLTNTDSAREAFSSDSIYFLLNEPDGVWAQMLGSMVKGDSSIFIIDKEHIQSSDFSYFQKRVPDSLSKLRLEVKLLDRSSPSALLEHKADHIPGVVQKEQWKEWKRIKAFVEDMAVDPEEHFVEGIYLFPERKGQGRKIEEGRVIEFHYRGYLPDSTVFDDSYKRGEPMRFKYGDPKQVIPGLEIGLGHMREGGKAEFVIPSYLAFGKKGGKTGVLPPHTFVFYEVEVMNVQPL